LHVGFTLLLQKEFVRASKILFLGEILDPPLIFTTKNNYLQDRICSPPLKINL